MFSLNILSAVRAYVGGESLWSKGQKTPFMPFIAMPTAATRRFGGAIPASPGVIAGDRRARRRWSKPNPIPMFAREGFLAGGNAPSDVDNLIWLFVEFRDDEDISRGPAVARG